MFIQTEVKTHSVIKTDKEKLFALAAEQHWGIREVHNVDPGWRFEPMSAKDLANCNVPVEGLERLFVILKSDIRIKGLMMGHEVPVKPVEIPWKVAPMLPWVVTPEEPKTPEIRPYTPPQSKPDNTSLIIAGVVAGVVLLPLIMPVIGIGLLVLGGMSIDPSLVVVLQERGTEEETWIEIYRWYEPSEE